MKDKQNEMFAYGVGFTFFMGMMIPFVSIAYFIFGIPSWGATFIVVIPMFGLLIPTNMIIGKLEFKIQKVNSVK